MDKVRVYHHESATSIYYYCPGCKHHHSVPTPRWNWNGSIEFPTVTPSVKHTAPPTNYCCHYFITDGKFHYCGDCSHSLSGQVVDMLPPETGEEDDTENSN